jgi:ubiquinone/menaquinone biosynthesis C-methylase UbiE
MLSQALRRFSENNISNVEFVRGDVSALPFFNETFDIVMSMNGFHVFPNKETAFYETARVLKKGGILCGCFYIRGRFRPTDFLVNSIMARKGWFTPPFYTKEELTAQFKRYYSKVEVYNIKAEAYFRCVK